MPSSPDARRSLDAEFNRLAAYAEQVWGQLAVGRPNVPQFSPSALEPPVDVYQTGNEVVVVVEAPGMRDQEVRLEVEAGRLTIHGQKRNLHGSRDHLYSQMEIACGPFQRTVEFPVAVDPDGAAVRYNDGYIEIRLPRAARRLERSIRIIVHQH